MVDRAKLSIAITGAGGFVGSRLARFFTRQGHHVIPLGRSYSGDGDQRFFSLDAVPAPDLLLGVDIVVHCAYDFADRRSAEANVNVKGSAALFRCAREAGSVPVHISSMSAFEGCKSRYGQTKLVVERLCTQHGGLNVRAGLVYDPEPGGLMGSLARLAKLPVVPLVAARALQYPVHTEDLGRCIEQVVGQGPPFPDFVNACQETPMSLRELMAFLAPPGNWGHVFVPVPWQILWLSLRFVEVFGIRVRPGSDSLLGLVYFNKHVAHRREQDGRPSFRSMMDGPFASTAHPTLRPSHGQDTRHKLLKFGVSGMFSVGVDAGAYALLYGHLDVYIAKGASFIIANVVTFLLNKYWVFRSKRLSARELVLFVGMYALSANLNAALNKHALLLSGNEVLAFLVATVVTAACNFLALKLVVFREPAGPKEGPGSRGPTEPHPRT